MIHNIQSEHTRPTIEAKQYRCLAKDNVFTRRWDVSLAVRYVVKSNVSRLGNTYLHTYINNSREPASACISDPLISAAIVVTRSWRRSLLFLACTVLRNKSLGRFGTYFAFLLRHSSTKYANVIGHSHCQK